jgi:hypothetical protein
METSGKGARFRVFGLQQIRWWPGQNHLAVFEQSDAGKHEGLSDVMGTKIIVS